MNLDLLLDTNVLLWLVAGDERASWLERFVRDDSMAVTVSSVALTEIAIKHSIGKIPADVPAVRRTISGFGILDLAFSSNHAEQLGNLPQHHRDPFDRMLIAQAMAEEMVLATSDRALSAYEGLQLHLVPA